MYKLSRSCVGINFVCAKPRLGAFQRASRHVPNGTVNQSEGKGRIRKERDRVGPRVLMRRPLLHRQDSGSRSAVGPADPPSFPRLQATAVVFAVWHRLLES